MWFSLDGIKKQGLQTVTPVLITDMDHVDVLTVQKEGSVRQGEPLLRVEKNDI